MLVGCSGVPDAWFLPNNWTNVDCPNAYYSFETDANVTLHSNDDDTSTILVTEDAVR